MKKIILLLSVLLMNGFLLSADDNIFLEGIYGNWDASRPMVQNGDCYECEFQFSEQTGEVEFKVHNTTNDEWYGRAASPVIINSESLTLYSADGSNVKQTLINSEFYTFRTWASQVNTGGDGNKRDLVIFETAATPVTITTVTDNSPSAIKEVDIAIVLSATPSSQEKVYVKYTTDSWTDSSFVEATGTDENYSAQIPVWGGNVEYDILTTTMPQATFENESDVYFLKKDDNSGNHYTYSINEAIYEGKICLRTDTGLAYINNEDFNNLDLGEFNAVAKLNLNSFQVFDYIWTINIFENAKAFYRVYKLDAVAPDFTEINIPWNSNWETSPQKQLWWNADNDTTNVDLLLGLENGTYNIEIYFSMKKNGSEDFLYLNADGANYIASFEVKKNSTQLADATTSEIKVSCYDHQLKVQQLSGQEQEMSVSLINLAGQVAMSHSTVLSSCNNYIDMPSSLNSGIYIVRLNAGEQQITKKICIK